MLNIINLISCAEASDVIKLHGKSLFPGFTDVYFYNLGIQLRAVSSL